MNLRFVLAILIMALVSIATVMVNWLLFSDQPGMQLSIALVWSVGLAIGAVKMLRFKRSLRAAAMPISRQQVYDAMLFVIELVSIATVVIITLMYASTLTLPEMENTALPLATAVVGLIVLSIPTCGYLLRQSQLRKVRPVPQPVNSRRIKRGL